MTIIEYPKALYLRGWDDLDECITVYDREQEEQAREDGYRSLSEPVAAEDAPDAPKRRGRPPKAPAE